VPDNLSASVSEKITADDVVVSRITSVSGLVAILDALGTKLLSLPEAIKFVALRDSIQDFTEKVVETSLPGLDMKRLSRFTFNDTVAYVYNPPSGVTLREVEQFCHVLRAFETHSIIRGTPFRGALAVGDFYIGDERTVLGPAVSDAASWFEAADWIGIHATPHSSILIQSLLEKRPETSLDHVLVDYDVPLKRDKSTRRLKAVNWPKGFFVRGLRPAGIGTTRGLVLSAFAQGRVPKDTELKYFNAIQFFDAVERSQDLENGFGAEPSQAPDEAAGE
jgi:hypothetical protein